MIATEVSNLAGREGMREVIGSQPEKGPAICSGQLFGREVEI